MKRSGLLRPRVRPDSSPDPGEESSGEESSEEESCAGVFVAVFVSHAGLDLEIVVNGTKGRIHAWIGKGQ